MSDALGSARGGTRGPAPSIDLDARVGIAFRHAVGDVDVLARRARPTISSTGIRSSPRRSQFDGCAPCPSTRSWCVRRSTVLRGPAFVDARPRRGGSVANSGCASQRSRNASTPSRSISSRERARRLSRRAARSASSAMPGDALTSTRSSHDVGTVERELQAQPPAHASSRRRSLGRPRRRARAAVATKSRPSGTSSARSTSSRARR